MGVSGMISEKKITITKKYPQKGDTFEPSELPPEDRRSIHYVNYELRMVWGICTPRQST